MKLVVATLGTLLFCAWTIWGSTLRIVSYNIDCADQASDNNITGPTHSLPTVIQALGLHHLGTNAQMVTSSDWKKRNRPRCPVSLRN